MQWTVQNLNVSVNFLVTVFSTFREFFSASHYQILHSDRCSVDNYTGLSTFTKKRFIWRERVIREQCYNNLACASLDCFVQCDCSLFSCLFSVTLFVPTKLQTQNCLPNWILQSPFRQPDTLSCFKCTCHEGKTNIHCCFYNCLNWGYSWVAWIPLTSWNHSVKSYFYSTLLSATRFPSSLPPQYVMEVNFLCSSICNFSHTHLISYTVDSNVIFSTQFWTTVSIRAVRRSFHSCSAISTQTLLLAGCTVIII